MIVGRKKIRKIRWRRKECGEGGGGKMRNEKLRRSEVYIERK